MSERATRWALWLHPRPWRDRYGIEISDLSDELVEAGETTRFRLILGLLASAVREWVRAAYRRPRQVSLGAAMMIAVGGGGAVLLHVFLASTPDAQNRPTVGGPISYRNGRVKGPDFVAVEGKGKIAGYEPISYLFPTNPSGSHVGEVAPVYSRDLHTLVGHEYPGVGFVPLGQSWTSEPCAHEATTDDLSQWPDGDYLHRLPLDARDGAERGRVGHSDGDGNVEQHELVPKHQVRTFGHNRRRSCCEYGASSRDEGPCAGDRYCGELARPPLTIRLSAAVGAPKSIA